MWKALSQYSRSQVSLYAFSLSLLCSDSSWSRLCGFTVSSQNMPMGDELKWLLKEGGGCIFENPLPKIGPTSFKSRPTQVLQNPDITDL